MKFPAMIFVTRMLSGQRVFLKAAMYVLGTVLLTGTSVAAELDGNLQASIRDAIDHSLGTVTQGQLKVESVSRSPIPGIYEVVMNSGEILFSDEKGEYLLSGQMFMTTGEGLINLSAERRKGQAVEWLADIPEEEMIIFPAESEQARITVFTDVDCTYCRRLHSDIEQINEQGITVRYLAFPRGGANSTAYPKMISVWCASDRQRAITQAKHGQNMPDRECQNPVLEHHALGIRLGVEGTPAIVLEDGTLVPGYLDLDTLKRLVFGE